MVPRGGVTSPWFHCFFPDSKCSAGSRNALGPPSPPYHPGPSGHWAYDASRSRLHADRLAGALGSLRGCATVYSRAAHGYRARVPAVRSESFRSTQCWAPKLGIECLERSARTVNLEEGRPNMRRASAHRVVLTLILLFGSLGFASSASAECFKCVWQVGFGWLCAHTGPNESGKDYCTTASGGCQLAGTPCNTGGGCGGPANPCGPKDPTP